ncbi:hypothetical protein CA3LBN_002370 [Candidozyma haemuli]|uniref:Uncharacterized protein n=2 Tax=Candidozyma TaxID=3303203 RepID=A0ABX8I627_9ASCO|nr:hypothetical protein CA3LBN_002370 [[Candida] haemuloni]
MVHWKPRYFDIGVNFSDAMFQGCYNGSTNPKHPADVEQVIERAFDFNVRKMLITASSVAESTEHLDLVEKHKGSFGSTVGVHPCTVAQEFYGSLENADPLESTESKMEELKKIAEDGHARGLIKAFGEIGLDYDRLHYSTVEQQKSMFKRQLEVAVSLKQKLPLFLHMRAACDDFVDIIRPFVEKNGVTGVVHSFTGSTDELQNLLNLGFFIGINGCSLKTEENLAVAKEIPMDRLLIETDAPWCEIRKSHASHKFLKPYPNLFYPEIPVPDVSTPPPGKKQQQPKLDDFLPYPSIKKENYYKHTEATQKRLENLGEAPSTKVGEFAYPLMKSRNEPVFVGHVACIMASLYELKTDEEIMGFIDTVYENSCTLFNL